MLEKNFKEIFLKNEDYQTLKNQSNFSKVVKSWGYWSPTAFVGTLTLQVNSSTNLSNFLNYSEPHCPHM